MKITSREQAVEEVVRLAIAWKKDAISSATVLHNEDLVSAVNDLESLDTPTRPEMYTGADWSLAFAARDDGESVGQFCARYVVPSALTRAEEIREFDRPKCEDELMRQVLDTGAFYTSAGKAATDRARGIIALVREFDAAQKPEPQQRTGPEKPDTSPLESYFQTHCGFTQDEAQETCSQILTWYDSVTDTGAAQKPELTDEVIDGWRVEYERTQQHLEPGGVERYVAHRAAEYQSPELAKAQSEVEKLIDEYNKIWSELGKSEAELAKLRAENAELKRRVKEAAQQPRDATPGPYGKSWSLEEHAAHTVSALQLGSDPQPVDDSDEYGILVQDDRIAFMKRNSVGEWEAHETLSRGSQTGDIDPNLDQRQPQPDAGPNIIKCSVR